jgi:hypothetical protein
MVGCSAEISRIGGNCDWIKRRSSDIVVWYWQTRAVGSRSQPGISRFNEEDVASADKWHVRTSPLKRLSVSEIRLALVSSENKAAAAINIGCGMSSTRSQLPKTYCSVLNIDDLYYLDHNINAYPISETNRIVSFCDCCICKASKLERVPQRASHPSFRLLPTFTLSRNNTISQWHAHRRPQHHGEDDRV